MAKTKAAPPTEVAITYDLFDLPTAFHKAGLAGLLLLLKSLTEYGEDEDRATAQAAWDAVTLTPTAATVPFTPPLLQLLMDDLYDAQFVERAVKASWGDKVKPCRPVTPEEHAEGYRYVYRVVEPRGRYVRDHYPPMDDGKGWHKLWREMLWNIPRGRPATRLPYDQRAARETCKEGPDAWADLLKVDQATKKGQVHTAEVSGALLLGAQTLNAEAVPYEGRAEHNLLLHFWPLTVLLFVPQAVDRDGATEFVGYTVAVPEVADLTEFLDRFPNLLNTLSDKPRGYRPAGAVIDLPAEGALSFLANLARVIGGKVTAGDLVRVLGSVEFLHLYKQGNNVKTLSTDRIVPSQPVLEGYQELAPAGKPPPYRSPLFRRGLLQALLDGRPEWWRPFAPTFKNYEETVFLRPVWAPPGKPDGEKADGKPAGGKKAKEFKDGKLTDAGKKRPPTFAADAAKKLRESLAAYTQRLEMARMSDAPPPPKELPELVDQVIRRFVLGKAMKKCNIDPDTKWKALTDAQKADVRKKKRDVAREAFLACKARHDQDLIAYFSEVLCSAGTFFDRRTNDFKTFADCLIDRDKTADLKTLTLLSLSANS